MPATRSEITRLLERLEAQLGPSFLEAVAQITSRAQLNQLVTALESGDITAAVDAAGIRSGSWGALTEASRAAYLEAGAFTILADVPARFGMTFDINNPRAEAWIRQNSSNLITFINNDQREAIRVVLEAGLQAGRNPRNVALDIVGRMSPQTKKRVGGIVGLNDQQAMHVVGMRRSLTGPLPVGVERLTEKGKPVKTFWIGNDGTLKSSYQRRDRRFDSIIKKAIESETPLDEATINRLTGRYSDRLLELRGTTIGRTEALRTLNASADEAMQQVIDEGLAQPEAVKRVWRHSFSKNERPGHLAMSGQERGMGEPFVNPLTKVELVRPGEGPASEVINCRCWLQHKVDFVAIEKAA